MKWRLGEILIQNGWVTWEHLTRALEIQEQLNRGLDPSIPMSHEKGKKKTGLNLGELLIRDKSITWDNLEKALHIQKTRGGVLGNICVDEGFVTEEQLYRALAIQGGFVYVNFETINVQPKVIEPVTPLNELHVETLLNCLIGRPGEDDNAEDPFNTIQWKFGKGWRSRLKEIPLLENVTH